MTIQRAIKVEAERYVQHCEMASAAKVLLSRKRHLHLAHIHYLALVRLRKYI